MLFLSPSNRAPFRSSCSFSARPSTFQQPNRPMNFFSFLCMYQLALSNVPSSHAAAFGCMNIVRFNRVRRDNGL